MGGFIQVTSIQLKIPQLTINTHLLLLVIKIIRFSASLIAISYIVIISLVDNIIYINYGYSMQFCTVYYNIQLISY